MLPDSSRGYLPRLPAENYCGRVAIFWTHTINDRACGWLDSEFHRTFREIMLHVAVREQLLCPIYTLMPDHLHMVWIGVSNLSDQRRACAFLRKHLKQALAPFHLQHQAYDHVLRQSERQVKAFTATCHYIAENPVRAGLAASAANWPFTGCLVPGYPDLHPLAQEFWAIFWPIHNGAAEHGTLYRFGAVEL